LDRPERGHAVGEHDAVDAARDALQERHHPGPVAAGAQEGRRLDRVLLVPHPAQAVGPAAEPLAGVAGPCGGGPPVQAPGRRPPRRPPRPRTPGPRPPRRPFKPAVGAPAPAAPGPTGRGRPPRRGAAAAAAASPPGSRPRRRAPAPPPHTTPPTPRGAPRRSPSPWPAEIGRA